MSKKKQIIEAWRKLRSRSILKHMTPVPYGATGSRYGTCGIRIDGNKEFIDAVLSNVKELLEGESDSTRLDIARTTVKPTDRKGFDNREVDAEVCYIRLCQRGGKR